MSFARTERACNLHRHEHVSRAVNRFDQGLSFIVLVLELRPQTMDIHIERVFLHIGGTSPSGLNQLFAGSNQALMADQSFEQFELLPRERDFLTVANRY